MIMHWSEKPLLYDCDAVIGTGSRLSRPRPGFGCYVRANPLPTTTAAVGTHQTVSDPQPRRHGQAAASATDRACPGPYADPTSRPAAWRLRHRP
jgi:hypothetical protein